MIIKLKPGTGVKFWTPIIMTITIDGQSFDFADDSKVVANRYYLDIEEPGFDKSSEKQVGGGTSKKMYLPGFIEHQIVRCRGLEPCSRVYKDANSKLRLTAYFD